MLNPILTEDIESIYLSLPEDKFQNSTVLITGCAGFLGFYFMQYFLRKSQRLGLRRVIALDNFLLDKPLWLINLKKEFPDILDLQTFDIARDQMTNISKAKDVNYVIHMASIASPIFYRQYPLETVDANIWGLRQLLEFYKNSNELKGFLFFSSSEIYGDPPTNAIPTDEEFRGNVSCNGPRSCYDESKRFGETLCYIFSKIHGLPITIARPFNNYGPGMRITDRRLPADFARCIVEGKDITIFSDGSPTRTFCYVSDAISGYLKCLLHGSFDYFNIGIEKPEIMVRSLAEIYRQAGEKIFAYRGRVIYHKSNDPDYLVDNPNRRCPQISKAQEKLNYNPKTFIEEGVLRYLTFLKYEGLS